MTLFGLVIVCGEPGAIPYRYGVIVKTYSLPALWLMAYRWL